MTEAQIMDLMFSLAWSSWSAYHSENAESIISEHFPNVGAKKALRDFREIIESPAGKGSPK